MATAISVANFESALGECYDAIESGDFAEAWREYAKAQAQLGGLISDASDADGNSYRREQLDSLREALVNAEERITRKGVHSRMIRTKTGFSGDGNRRGRGRRYNGGCR